MSKPNLVMDIETTPDYSRSDLWLAGQTKPQFVENAPDPSWSFPVAEQAWIDGQMKKMALQPEACMMVGLNVIKGDGPPLSGWVGEPRKDSGEPWTERQLLELFWSWAAECPRIIGFNCLRFDVPVIKVRSAILGVLPTCDLTNLKPWETRVLDLLRLRFNDSNRDSYMSLKALRRMLQLPIPEKYAEVIDNNGGDVETLYLRFMSGDQDALRLLKLYGELDALTTKLLAQHWSGYFYQRID